MAEALRDQVAKAIGETNHPGAYTWWENTSPTHAARRACEREADAAIGVVLGAVVAGIEALRQRHIDDHGDAECVTTREIAYGEVAAAIGRLGASPE